MTEFKLFSWGANSHGQLGHGDIQEEELTIPRQIDVSSVKLKVENIVKITGGAGHTFILDKEGRLYSCGWNDKGQTGTLNSSSRLQSVSSLENEKIVDIVCGWDSSMALNEKGDLFVWGSNSHGQLGSKDIGVKAEKPIRVNINVPVRRISMGLRHSVLITYDSRLFVSGAATKGQLGVDTRGVRFFDTFTEVPDLPPVKNVSCGQHHTIVLSNKNELFAWGDNKHGQLGVDPKLCKSSSTPTKIEFHKNIDEIHCGWTHSAVVTVDRQVFSWGRNTYGQLGRAKTTPVAELWIPEIPKSLSKVRQFSVGSEHNIALSENGRVLSWGWNEHGNCGNGNLEDTFETTNVKLPDGSGILVGSGAGHSFAVVETNQ